MADSRFHTMLQAVQSYGAHMETMYVPLVAQVDQLVQTLEDKTAEDVKVRREALRQVKQLRQAMEAAVRNFTSPEVPAADDETENEPKSRSRHRKADEKTEEKADA